MRVSARVPLPDVGITVLISESGSGYVKQVGKDVSSVGHSLRSLYEFFI